MLVRWLLPVVAVLAFLGTSLTTFAAAGPIGSTQCCCPDPDACKCHDHDGEPRPAPEMKRCGNGVDLVSPKLTAAVLPDTLDVVVTEQRMTIEFVEEPQPPARFDHFERPPS